VNGMKRYISTKEAPGRLGEALRLSSRKTKQLSRRGALLRPFQLKKQYGKQITSPEFRELGGSLLESGKLKRAKRERLKKLMKRPRRGFF